MTANLLINDVAHPFPGTIDNLEALLSHAMAESGRKKEVVVEVQVDGERYNEQYAHQAGDLDLESVGQVAVTTCAADEFARSFLSRMPDFMGQVREGFRVSAHLLRDPEKEEEGNDMLARSMDALKDVKDHHDNACRMLDEKNTINPEFWNTMGLLAETFLSAQEDMDPVLMADLLEDELIPHMERWR